MTGIDTAAIEARLAAATPGPWVRRHGNVEHYFPHIGEYGDICTPDDANADLIAHAPTDLRNLLDRLAAVEAERDEAMARLAAVREVTAAWASDQSSGVKVHCGRKLRDALDGDR